MSRPTSKLFWKITSTSACIDSPLSRNFEYNDNSSQNQKVFQPIAGNILGDGLVYIKFTNQWTHSRKKQ